MKNTIKAIILATLVLSFYQFAAAAPPVNDNWGDAILITGVAGTANGTLAEATKQTCEPDHVLADEGSATAYKTVWYKFQVPETASYTFKTSSGSFTTVLSAYRFLPGICNGNVTTVPYRVIENRLHNQSIDARSKISFKAIAGEVIYISVDSASADYGTTFGFRWAKTRFRYSLNLDYKDSITDLAVLRWGQINPVRWTARFGKWSSYGTFAAMPYGLNSDYQFYADFDGDGVSDHVAVRSIDGTLIWYIVSRDGAVISIRTFGALGDRPVIGDFDGDGMADFAVYRWHPTEPNTFHIIRSSDGVYTGFQFGRGGDRPLTGDYDGDGVTDIVMIRSDGVNDTWYIRKSSDGGVLQRAFGYTAVDVPQVGDFDGDGKTDVAIYRRSSDSWGGHWFFAPSSDGQPFEQKPISIRQFGKASDVPQAGDYDGDGITDLAVYRDGNWWIMSSQSNSITVYNFGIATDKPMADMGIPKGGSSL